MISHKSPACIPFKTRNQHAAISVSRTEAYITGADRRDWISLRGWIAPPLPPPEHYLWPGRHRRSSCPSGRTCWWHNRPAERLSAFLYILTCYSEPLGSGVPSTGYITLTQINGSGAAKKFSPATTSAFKISPASLGAVNVVIVN